VRRERMRLWRRFSTKDVIETDDDDDVDAEEPCASRVEEMDLCRQLERVVLEYDEGKDLVLSKQLCRFRARLVSRQEMRLANVAV
jgi:hypothetical protein